MSKLADLARKIHNCAASDSAHMLRLYQKYLALILDAEKVTWYAGYRGDYGRNLWQTRLMLNWKVVDVALPLDSDRDFAKEAKFYFQKAREKGDIDPQVTLAVNNAGRSRVHLLREAINPEEWEFHWMRELLHQQNIGERMVGAFNLSPDAESYFLIDRPCGATPFSEKDKQHFLEELLSFPRVHYWLFLERGLVAPASTALSPRQRDVLLLLHSKHSEAKIAEQLKLAPGTVHNYIGDIYKCFNVGSRYELMQLWLGSIPGN